MALVWEELEVESPRSASYGGCAVSYAKRAKIPGGWLIAIFLGNSVGLTFYPDPNHVWNGKSLP